MIRNGLRPRSCFVPSNTNKSGCKPGLAQYVSRCLVWSLLCSDGHGSAQLCAAWPRAPCSLDRALTAVAHVWAPKSPQTALPLKFALQGPSMRWLDRLVLSVCPPWPQGSYGGATMSFQLVQCGKISADSRYLSCSVRRLEGTDLRQAR